jgi:hypothetical protein
LYGGTGGTRVYEPVAPSLWIKTRNSRSMISARGWKPCRGQTSANRAGDRPHELRGGLPCAKRYHRQRFAPAPIIQSRDTIRWFEPCVPTPWFPHEGIAGHSEAKPLQRGRNTVAILEDSNGGRCGCAKGADIDRSERLERGGGNLPRLPPSL